MSVYLLITRKQNKWWLPCQLNIPLGIVPNTRDKQDPFKRVILWLIVLLMAFRFLHFDHYKSIGPKKHYHKHGGGSKFGYRPMPNMTEMDRLKAHQNVEYFLAKDFIDRNPSLTESWTSRFNPQYSAVAGDFVNHITTNGGKYIYLSLDQGWRDFDPNRIYKEIPQEHVSDDTPPSPEPSPSISDDYPVLEDPDLWKMLGEEKATNFASLFNSARTRLHDLLNKSDPEHYPERIALGRFVSKYSKTYTACWSYLQSL